MKQHKLNCSKEAWGIFSFFSSTNVETKNVCPIAYNVLVFMSGFCSSQKLALNTLLSSRCGQSAGSSIEATIRVDFLPLYFNALTC